MRLWNARPWTDARWLLLPISGVDQAARARANSSVPRRDPRALTLTQPDMAHGVSQNAGTASSGKVGVGFGGKLGGRRHRSSPRQPVRLSGCTARGAVLLSEQSVVGVAAVVSASSVDSEQAGPLEVVDAGQDRVSGLSGLAFERPEREPGRAFLLGSVERVPVRLLTKRPLHDLRGTAAFEQES